MTPNDVLAAQYGVNATHLHELPPGPVTLVNLFRLRAEADYPDGSFPGRTGTEAMLAYASVSGDRLEAVGGRFLTRGLPVGLLWGSDGVDWDVVVVAEYPNADAVRALLDDAEYQQAFVHRRAAVEQERVLACSSF